MWTDAKTTAVVGAAASARGVVALPAGPARRKCAAAVRAKAGVSSEPPLATAPDDEQERRLRVRLLDEGSTATTAKAEGYRWGRAPTRRGRLSIRLQGRRRSKVLVAPESPAKQHLPTASASRHRHDCPVIVR